MKKNLAFDAQFFSFSLQKSSKIVLKTLRTTLNSTPHTMLIQSNFGILDNIQNDNFCPNLNFQPETGFVLNKVVYTSLMKAKCFKRSKLKIMKSMKSVNNWTNEMEKMIFGAKNLCQISNNFFILDFFGIFKLKQIWE